MTRVPSSPAEVKPKALDDIKGVEEVPVSKAEPEVVEAIETKIDRNASKFNI